MKSFSEALVTRVSSLRDSPLYSDLEILTPTRSFFAHKIVLSARSRDWGRGVDLSSSAVAVLNWEVFSDQTCGDVIDYIYLDKNKFLLDKTYDDVRGIELLSAATFFSLNELVGRCEKYIGESKLRYPLEPASPAVLMKVALEASDLNLKQPDKRSILKINNVSKVKARKASLEDISHDHCYVEPPPPRKKRKLKPAKNKKATEEVDCNLQMDVINNNNNNESDVEMKMDSVVVVKTLLDIILTTVHYNALLRMHLENGHKFRPEQVLEDMRKHGAAPDKETYQCLISRHYQEGNIEGASKVLQMMKNQGIQINENDFISLILGHRDITRSHGMLKVMKQWGLPPSQETYLTLACGFAKAGDWETVEEIMSECNSQGVGFHDSHYLELVYVVSEGSHKEHIAKLLALTHPETEAFRSMASHLVVRLVNSGHDDVAYNLVQYTMDQSTEKGGTMVSEEFLQQIVRCVNNLNCYNECCHS